MTVLDGELAGARDWTPDGPSGPVSSAERDRLVVLEETIDAGLTTFIAVGTALAEVRDSRLYRDGYQTFELYCSCRWTLSRSRAYQLMAAAEVVSTVVDTDPTAPAPANEGQARALAAAPAEERADVMATVAERGKPTAAAIAEEVEARHPKPVGAASPPRGPAPAPTPAPPPAAGAAEAEQEPLPSTVWACGECLAIVPEASDLTDGLCADCRPEQTPAAAAVAVMHLEYCAGRVVASSHQDDALASPRGLRLHLVNMHGIPTSGLTFGQLHAAHDGHHQDHGAVAVEERACTVCERSAHPEALDVDGRCVACQAGEIAQPRPTTTCKRCGTQGLVWHGLCETCDPTHREGAGPAGGSAKLSPAQVRKFCLPAATLGRVLSMLPAPDEALAVISPEVAAEYDELAGHVVDWAKAWKRARAAQGSSS